MTKSYLILQAKISELESILNDALLLGPETHSHDDIKQKLAFIGNLLSAEIASHPSKPHHLHHISQRLASLEKVFHDWDTFRTFSSADLFDRDSTCSCTESCLNDDGDESELIVFEDPQKLFPDFIGDNNKAIVEFRGYEKEETGKNNIGTDKLGSFDYEDAEDCFAAGDKELMEFDGGLVRKTEGEEEEEDNNERRDSAFGKKVCCAFAGGVVIGMIFMGFIMGNLTGCSHYVEQASFYIPT
ncbi:hypothetical protein SESBI_42422 [Sesbania bispinosa]|nr:hypothetical protein SESBI_42422 [Sesbania bispinosa]